MREEAAQSLRELNEVIERLRAPGGCPWDRAQTHRSLRPYLLEETYETLEAIDSQGTATLREELGDLLLQVLMHCAIAAERGNGSRSSQSESAQDGAGVWVEFVCRAVFFQGTPEVSFACERQPESTVRKGVVRILA